MRPKAAARARAAVEEVDSTVGLRQVADLFSRVWAAHKTADAA